MDNLASWAVLSDLLTCIDYLLFFKKVTSDNAGPASLLRHRTYHMEEQGISSGPAVSNLPNAEAL